MLRRLPGEPCWIDLATSDLAATRGFYEAVLGWRVGASDEYHGGHAMFRSDGEPVAGVRPRRDEERRDAWTTYVCVDDVTQSLEAAIALGGAFPVGPRDVDSLGQFGTFRDPQGAHVGLWRAGEFAGFSHRGEVGEVVWFELDAREIASALAFYTALFDWTPREVGEPTGPRRVELAHSEGPIASLRDVRGDLGEFAEPSWLVCFGVRDLDFALEAARGVGGSVVGDVQDTPLGPSVRLLDATGAELAVTGVG